MLNQTDVTTKRKYYLDSLKAIAIIMVLMHHAMDYGYHYFTPEHVYMAVMNFISYIHVPVFFMIAGYLCHEQDYKKFCVKRIKQLLVPFLFFTAIKLIVNLYLLTDFAHTNNMADELRSAFLNGEYYWFSYSMLIMFIGIAPLLWKLKNRIKLIWVIAAVAAGISIADGILEFLPQPGPFQIFNTITYLVWFVLGFGFAQMDFSRFSCRKYRAAGLIISSLICIAVLILSTFRIFDSGWYIYKLLVSFSGSYILLSIFRNVREFRLLTFMGKHALQIMFLDSFIKVLLYYTAFKITTVNVAIVFVIVILNIALSTFITFLVSKVKGLRFLFGM